MKFRLSLFAFTSVISFSILGSLSASQGYAAFVPGWERPTQRAEMDVAQSRFNPSPVTKVIVTLTRRDGSAAQAPTGMIVEFQNLHTGQVTVQALEIDSVRADFDQCGSVEYVANAVEQNPQSIEDCKNSSPISVHLVDYVNYRCSNTGAQHPQAQWQAKIGANGMIMSASGTPEDVVTVQGGDASVQ